MPIDSQDTAIANAIIQERCQPCRGFIFGEVEVIRVEQRSIHDMEGKLQKTIGTERLEDLAGARTITYCFVVTHSGIIREVSLLQNSRRFLISVKPVHSHSCGSGGRHLRNAFRFFERLRPVVPSIDSMEADLATGSSRSLNFRRNIKNIVAGTPRSRRPACSRMIGPPGPRPTCKRYNKESRRTAVFEIQITIEAAPNVLGQTKVDKRQLRDRSQVRYEPA